MQHPIVSVIISTYNAASTIGAALDGLANQTAPHELYEVIVVDDGSTDTTKDVVANYQKKIPLTYIFQKNVGVGIARNNGISHAKGSVLAFTDADCVCDADWIATIYHHIVEEKKQLIGGTTYSHDVIIFPWKMAPVHHQGVTANLALDYTLLDHTQPVFNSGFKGMVGDDIDLVLRLEKNNIPLHYVPTMRVCHPANILTFERFILRCKGRANEVGLYKYHGKKAVGAFSPLFQPWLLGSISRFGLGCIVSIGGLIRAGSMRGWTGVISPLLLGIGLFLVRGYNVCILYSPVPNPIITWKERIKTLGFCCLFVPLFLYHRVRGMILFQYFFL